MINLFRHFSRPAGELLTSQLHDQSSFYKAFVRDLNGAKRDIIIESPFMTTRRVEPLLPILAKAIKRGVKITVATRDPYAHNPPYDGFAIDAIAELQSVGVEVIYIGNHHRKLAIIDTTILWEGSLNILSQYDSCEIMRRSASTQLAKQMIAFIRTHGYLES